MSVAGGVVLFVIGAILTFAVQIDVPGVSLSTIGLILMIAGALVFVLGLVFMIRGRRSVTSSRSAVDPASGDRVTRQSTSTTDDPRY